MEDVIKCSDYMTFLCRDCRKPIPVEIKECGGIVNSMSKELREIFLLRLREIARWGWASLQIAKLPHYLRYIVEMAQRNKEYGSKLPMSTTNGQSGLLLCL